MGSRMHDGNESPWAGLRHQPFRPEAAIQRGLSRRPVSEDVGSPVLVLIVDDVELDRLAIRRALQGTDIDFEVRESTDVDTAWTVLGEDTVDLVLLDPDVAGGTGLDLLRLMTSRGLGVPVIALTGRDDRRAAVEVMKAGAHEYLYKADLSAGLLRAIVPSVLRAARARMEEVTAQERLSLAAATADIGIWDYYPDSGDLVLSGRARALLGLLPGADVDYGLFLSLVHAEDRARVDEAMNARSGAVRGADFQVDFRVGHGPPLGIRWLTAKGREVARETSGVAAPPHVVGVLADVTGRKAAERAAGERAEIVESLHRFGEAMTTSIGRDDVIQLATAEARRLLGAEIGAFVARESDGGNGPRVVAVAGDDAEEGRGLDPSVRELPFAGEGESALASGGLTYFGVPVVSASSGIVGGLVFGTRGGELDERAVRLARGIAGWAAVAIENARLLRAERDARDEAEAAVRARNDTLAVVTHDLRNPLNTVLVTSGLILKGRVPPDEVEDQMDVIKRAGHHMQRLINDLLDTAKIDSGTFSIQTESVDPVPLMEEVAGLFAQRVGDKGVELLVNRDAPDGLRIRADPVRVVQALGNLVANAVKFTEAGGEIRLDVVPGRHDVRFVVEDSGTGVPDAELPHIFKRFWQGRPGDRAGAGLGLGIVKGIAEAHGGDVGVSTNVGKGSRFWFSVPRAGVPQEASAEGDDDRDQPAAE